MFIVWLNRTKYDVLLERKQIKSLIIDVLLKGYKVLSTLLDIVIFKRTIKL
jgi:hypothetical protein